jgi:uncharacterized protein YsxB (DUF464 family)
MIKVTYNPAEYRMEIQGHAEYGEYGHDIVCSAASMLTMTLENMVNDHAESLIPQRCRSEGKCKVSCSPTKGNKQKCRTIFDTIFGGFELLSMNCPEYVQAVKIKEE